jgi:IclR family transcriptional regulator, acetate operon repressor
VDDVVRIARDTRANGEPDIHKPSTSGNAREYGGVQSVARALTLLEIIADLGGEASLTDIAGRAGLNVSTCHHLLSTLVNKGYAARGPNRRSYALGARVLYLSQVCLRQVDLPRRAAPFIERINVSTGETIHLAVRQGNSIIKILKRDARHAIRVDSASLGHSDAAHATATGKAIMAWLSQDDVNQLVAEHGMRRFTDKTITDMPALVDELSLVRRSGYAMDREEFIPGVICMAAAIRDHSGSVLGAIGASTPAMRANEQHLAMVRTEVVSAARALSVELGAQAV